MDRKIIEFPGRTPQERGRREEGRSAREKGARLVPGSGSGGHHLLDFKTWRILWSKKTTTRDQSTSKTISIPVKDIDEARSAARSRGAMWAYEFEFNGRDLILQDKADWHEIAGSEEPELKANEPARAKAQARLNNAKNPWGGTA
jgi:hypothetical protein